MKTIKKALIILLGFIGISFYIAEMRILLDSRHWGGTVMLIFALFCVSLILAAAGSTDDKKETALNTEQHGNKET